MNERKRKTKVTKGATTIAKLSSRNWKNGEKRGRKEGRNFSDKAPRNWKDRKGEWNRMGRIYQTDYTIKIRRRFDKSENHWVSMLDQPASGGLIKYNSHPHPPPSNVVAPLVARVKRAIFFTKKKKTLLTGWSRIRYRVSDVSTLDRIIKSLFHRSIRRNENPRSVP